MGAIIQGIKRLRFIRQKKKGMHVISMDENIRVHGNIKNQKYKNISKNIDIDINKILK